jgi:Zn-dependent protease
MRDNYLREKKLIFNMIFNMREIIDLVFMTVIVGYIFMDMFNIDKHKDTTDYDPLNHYKYVKKGIDFTNLKFAILISAPAVIFHEMAHKFVSIGLGVAATFHASYFWLFIGAALKWLNTGFIFFVPGYVTHSALIPPLHSAAIAFAGPGTNLLLFLTAWAILKSGKTLKPNTLKIVYLTKQINMFLFFFNMIPLGFFDGAAVLKGVMSVF